MTRLDQFLTTSASVEQGSLGAVAKASARTDRMAVYSVFEADSRAQAAQPDASPLVRWMLGEQVDVGAETTSQALPIGRLERP